MTRVKLTNDGDVEKARAGFIPADQVRSVEIEALVDTGATMLVLPADVCERLGLPLRGKRKIRYADGRLVELDRAGSILLEILDREMNCDALVQAAGTTPLIGQVQLEVLDLIVDAKTRDLHVNPASPDAPLLEVMSAA